MIRKVCARSSSIGVLKSTYNTTEPSSLDCLRVQFWNGVVVK
jgi:hypothetical protein